MSLWHKIETAPASAAWFSWKCRFGDALPLVQAWFLKPAKKRAETVPCPLTCGCIHRVLPDNRAVCGCGDCEDIVLEDTDAEAWMVNWSGLGNRVREAFDLEHKAMRPTANKVWQVGSFGGDALQIIMVVQPDRIGFNEAIAQLVARTTKRFVVLTPTATHHDMESRELLATKKAGLHALESHLTILPSGRVVAKTTAGELLSTYLPTIETSIEDAAAMRMFAMRKKLRIAGKNHKAPHNDVFDLVVMEGRSQEYVAREFECSPGLISKRVDEIEIIMDLKLDRMKTLAQRTKDMDSTVKGDKTGKQRRGRLPSDSHDASSDEGEESDDQED